MREIIGHSKAKRKLHKHSVIPQDCMQYLVYQTILYNALDVQNGTGWRKMCWYGECGEDYVYLVIFRMDL